MATAEQHLSEIIETTSPGESVIITKAGIPVAQMLRTDRPRSKVDIQRLKTVTGMVPRQSVSADDFIRRMREDSRY